MRNLQCLVVDDEPMARKIIKEYISDIPFLDLAGEADTAEKAGIELRSTHTDLMFLDIEMPKQNGLDFLKNIPMPPITILTTAFSEFALEGFELNVTDYLLKPISYERFQKAVLKAYKHIETADARKQRETYFFVKVNQKIEKIYFADVLYIEGMTNYVIIHTKSKKLITYLTFKGIEDQLPQEKFIRIHKSYIVSTDAIKTIDANQMDVGGFLLPIGKSYKPALMSRIDSIFFRR